MGEFGMEDHQCLYGLHQDTDNYHLHIMLNRTDPLSGRAKRINKGFDIEALHKAIARIAHEQGWTPEAHSRYEVSQEGIVRSDSPGEEKNRKPSRIRDAERRTGEKSALSIAQEIVPALAREATGWQDFHGKLVEQGMENRLRGAGAVLLVGETPVKPSDVDRKLGLKALEKRWGPFEPPAPGLEKKTAHSPEPVNETAKALGFEDYAKARRLHLSGRKQSRAELNRRIAVERTACSSVNARRDKKRSPGAGRERERS